MKCVKWTSTLKNEKLYSTKKKIVTFLKLVILSKSKSILKQKCVTLDLA